MEKLTVKDFAKRLGISVQNVRYLINNDIVDYERWSERFYLILMTEKTLSYEPNLKMKR